MATPTKTVKLPTSTVDLIELQEGESIPAAILRIVEYAAKRKLALAKDHGKRAEKKAAEMAAFAASVTVGTSLAVKGGKSAGKRLMVAALAGGKVFSTDGDSYALRSVRLLTDAEIDENEAE